MKSKRVTSMISVGLAIAWLAACAASAPVQEISDARQAIAAAEEADAEQFAPQTLSEAREFLLQAEALIREGSFNLARGDAVRARTWAISALQASQAAQQAAAP
jgi:hypothetical protein